MERHTIFTTPKPCFHSSVIALQHDLPILLERQQDEDSKELRIANLEIRPEGLEVLVDGQRIGLTVREYQLFAALAVRANRVVQRSELYEAVWGNTMRHRDRSVDVVVRKIREKLTTFAPDWSYIHTHFGVGYRLHPERITPQATGAPDRDAGPAPPPSS